MTVAATATKKGWSLAGPALLWTAVFFLAPMALILIYSLFRRVGGTLDTSVSLDNYRRVLSEPAFRTALINSIEVSLITVVASLLISYPLAYFIVYRVPLGWQRPLMCGVIPEIARADDQVFRIRCLEDCNAFRIQHS